MKKIIYFILISFFSFILLSKVVLAESCGEGGACEPPIGGCTTPGVQITGTCEPVEGVNYICCGQATNPGSGTTTGNNKGFGFDRVANVAGSVYDTTNGPTLDQRISSIISVVLSLVGVLFMILMIYGGYIWMTAGGDEKKVEKAQDTIRAGIIGLIIVIAAYAISVFVVSKIWGSTTTTITTNSANLKP
jgi:hypothetical protein